MKNTISIIIVVILLIILGMQVFMFYHINEKLEQRYVLEKKLNLSSHQGTVSWVQEKENWNPYQELMKIRDQIENLIDESIAKVKKNASLNSLVKIPTIEFKEVGNRYVVTADIPNADESSLNVTLDGQKLNISANIKSLIEQKDNASQVLHKEKYSGEFQGYIVLPDDINKNGMVTEYKKGLLTVVIPKV